MKFYNFDVAFTPIRVLVKYINSRVNEKGCRIGAFKWWP